MVDMMMIETEYEYLSLFFQMSTMMAAIVGAIVAAHALSVWKYQFLIQRDHDLARRVLLGALSVRRSLQRIRESGDEPSVWLNDSVRHPRTAWRVFEDLLLEAEVLWSRREWRALADASRDLEKPLLRLVAKALMLEHHRKVMTRDDVLAAHQVIRKTNEPASDSFDQNLDLAIRKLVELLRNKIEIALDGEDVGADTLGKSASDDGLSQ